MPRVNVPGVGLIDFPDTMSQDAIVNAIENEILPSINKKPTDRTMGEAFTDIGAGLKSGAGSLLQFPGQVSNLITGNFEKPGEETGLTSIGKEMQTEATAMKSPGLLAREKARAEKVSEAEKSGQFSAFAAAFSETIRDPALITNFLAEQAPQLLVPFGAARIAKPLLGVSGAVSSAVGAGAVQQGADIGAGTYTDIYKALVDKGMLEPEAAGQAIGYARATGASAAVISLLAQRLPGARVIEEAFAGKTGSLGRLIGGARGAIGESISEGVEETPAKFAQNLALQQVVPETSLTKGLGETAAMAAIGGGSLGGAAGLLQRQNRGEVTPIEGKQPSSQFAPSPEPEPDLLIDGAVPPVEVEPTTPEEPIKLVSPSFSAPPEEAVQAMSTYWEGTPEDFGMSFADIQNRDRSKPASIQQMTSIAAEPDYNRLSESKDFGAGAPVVISDVEFNPKYLGRIDMVSASDGTKIPIQYAVIDVKAITPSNLADGTAIPEYSDPTFQGVRPVAGNGRVAGLNRAYENGTNTDYTQNLINDPSHGINSEAIKDFDRPVLVRIMPKSSLTPDIADKGNVGGQLGMSPTEQAKIDMGRFDLQGIEFLADGSPSPRSLRNFLAAMPKEEQAQLMNKQGQPNPLSKIRLANALFARAYENDGLIDLYAEATDPEAQQILRGMSIAAPAMSNLSGTGEYDIRQFVSKAAELAVNARRQGVDLATYASQGDIEMDPLTQEVVSMFANNRNAPRRIGDALTNLAVEAQKAYEQTQVGTDMFGNEPISRPIEEIFQTLRGEPTTVAPVVEEEVQSEQPKEKPERVEFVIDKDPAVIAKEIKGMSLPKLTQWLVDNAPNSVAKAIAEKMLVRINEFDKRGVPMTMRILNGANRSNSTTGKSAMSWGPQGVSFKVFLNGTGAQGISDRKTGTTYETIIHELLHVSTQTQLQFLPKNSYEIKDLTKLLETINDQIKVDVAAGKDHPFIKMMMRAKEAMPGSWTKFGPMKDIDEIITWGLTDPDYQNYISQIRLPKKQSAFTQFVDVLRKLLNLDPKYQTALEQVAAISEDILSDAAVDIAALTERGGTFLGTRTGQQSKTSPSEGGVESEMEIPEFIRKGVEKATKKGGIDPSQGFQHVDPEFLKRLEPIFSPEGKTFSDKMDKYKDRTFQRLAQGIADQYRTIKDISPLAYMKARLSKTVDGALEGLLFDGEVKLTDGALDIKQGTKGLTEALGPIGGEVNSFLIWLALNRDATLVEKGRIASINKDIVSDRNKLAEGKIGNESRLVVYEKVRKELNRLNRSVLDVALQKGLIDKAGYDTFLKDVYYIPFYKMVEEGEVADIRTSSGLANKYFSKQLKGGEKPFGDLMENLLRNWNHILSSSMKNDAAVETVMAATDIGAAFPSLKSNYEFQDGKVYVNEKLLGGTEIDGVTYADGELRPGIFSAEGKGLVKVMYKGFPAYFEIVDPLLLESIMSIGYMGPKSKFLDIARDFKNILQFGVTSSPAFKVRNLVRDSVQSAAVSGIGLNIAKNVSQGLQASNKNNPEYISALAGGAIFNFGTAFEGDQARLVRRLIDAGVDASTILTTEGKIKSGLAGAWKAYQDLGNKSESANRMSLYQQLKNKINPETGKNFSHLEASFYARDLLDFSMQGSWPALRVVTQVVPFLNARIQGLYKLGRDGIMPTGRVIYNSVTGKPIEATDKQKAQQFSIVTSATVLASLMLYMAFKDDEEFKKREQWDRDNFWWFRLPGMEAAIRIPKPFEIGAFGTLAERLAEQMFDEGAEGKVFGQSMKRMLTDTFAMNPTPQMFKPLIDLYSNKDSFTGSPIETAGMERLSKGERVATNTSPLAKLLSQVSNVFLPEATEISPVQTDYAIKAYLGWMGATIAATSHYAMMPFSKSAYPDKDWTDTVSLGFVKSLPATQSSYVTSFYENMKIIEQAYSDMRHYAEIGESEKMQAILEEKGDKIALAKFYDKTSKDMSRIRQVQRAIINDETMSGAQKKEEIDRLKELIAQLAQQAEEVRKSMRN